MEKGKTGKAKIRRLEKLAEEATTDCYNEYETFCGWACTLDDKLPLPLECRVFGEKAMLVGVETDESGMAVLGVIRKGRERIRMPVQDVKLAEAKPSGKSAKAIEWLEAYRYWLG
jgi:hypothetical protein